MSNDAGVGMMELPHPSSQQSEADAGYSSLTSLITSLTSSSAPVEDLETELDLEVPKLSGDVLESTCDEYSVYLSYPNLMQQQIKEADILAETILNRLDEVGALTDTIRNETNAIRSQLQQLVANCQQLPLLFDLVDQLLIIVEKLSISLNEIEAKVVEAEDENDTISFSKLLSFVGAKAPSHTFQPPSIPNTKDHFDGIRESQKEKIRSMQM
jgi:hypothetical protein